MHGSVFAMSYFSASENIQNSSIATIKVSTLHFFIQTLNECCILKLLAIFLVLESTVNVYQSIPKKPHILF